VSRRASHRTRRIERTERADGAARGDRAARAALALMAVLLVLITGCGIPLDDEPRALTGSLSTDPDAQTPATGDASDDTAYIFYVHTDGLVAVSTRVSDSNPDTVLTALLTTKPSGPDAETLISQIPAGTRLLDLERTGDLVRVDLSSEFSAANGPALQLAVGQIVLTLTDLPGIGSVGFRIDGKDATVSSPRGDATKVGTCDVVSLLAAPEEPPPTSLDRTTTTTTTTTTPTTSTDSATPTPTTSTSTSVPADTAALKRIELMAQCAGG